MVFAFATSAEIRLDRGRADVQAGGVVRAIHVRVRARILVINDRLALLVQLVGLDRHGDHVVHRQQEFHLLRLGLGQRGLGDVRLVRFDQRFAGLVALRQAERVSHRAANQDRVRLFQQPVNDLDLVRNLRAAENDDERAGRLLQFVAEELQFAFHQQAGGALAAALGHDAGHAFGRGMRAMGRAERVVHINVGDLRQLLGKRRVVLLLLVVIADVLQQQHVAGLHRGHGLLDLLADAIVHERHRFAEQVGQFGRDRVQRHGRVALAFGPAQVRGQDQLAALFDQQLQASAASPRCGWRR